jgi:creatinine amidohydrolase
MRPDLTPAPHDAPEVLGMKVTGFGTASFEGAEIDVPIELADITPDAVFGADALGCSAETGAKLVEAVTELGARFVRHYAAKTQ